MVPLCRYLFVFILFFATLCAGVRAADAPYVPTPWNVVDAMLKIGGVGANDYLMDLGSGDGRIVITAAKKLGARGFGVELDPNLVRTARREAERQGVNDRVAFETEDLFFIDLSKATVITMYMSESVNLRLRPSLFKLKPGTRIVSHDFDMAQWMPDQKLRIAVPGKSYGAPSSEIFLWIVPADFSGAWQWRMVAGGANHDYQAAFEQTFQNAEGKGRIASQSAAVGQVEIRGDTIRFVMGAEIAGKATWREFRGQVSGDTIDGSVVTIVEADVVHKTGEPVAWRATRTGRGKMNTDAAIQQDAGNSSATAFLTKEQQ